MRIPVFSNVTDRAASSVEEGMKQIVWTLRIAQGVFRYRRDYGGWPDYRAIWSAVRANRA